VTNPSISVVIPVYNGERYLGETLSGLLAEDYEPVEAIVVDDGSTDGSSAVAASLGVAVVSIAHGGPAVARNVGIRASTGDLIAFADADDPWLTGRLRRQVDRLIEAPGLGFVLGNRIRYVEPGTKLPPEAQLPWWNQPAPGHLQTALVRREAFGRVGLLVENMSFCDDVEWILRATRLGVRHEVMPNLLFSYRYHGENITSDVAAVRRSVFKLLRHHIAANRNIEA
jgi:glycosyltransferase involved in cell wall biosynthesis